MTITEDEIRTALQRAVDQADRRTAEPDDRMCAVPPRPPRALVLVAAAALVLVVVGLMAISARDGDQVRTGPASAPDATPDAEVTATTEATTTTEVTTTGALASTTTTEVPPSTVSVQVLNGSSTSGAAGVVSAQLGAIGYQMAPVGNAWQVFEHSVVYAADGSEDPARALADRLGIERTEPLPQDMPDAWALAGTDLVVVVGTDGVAVPG